MIKKISTVLIIGCVLGSILSGCGTTVPSRYEASFLELFDTITQVVGYSKSEEEFTEYSQQIYDDLNEYHQLFDIYHDYEGINNIKTINDQAGIAPVKVDRKLIDLLLYAKEMYTLTDGKINVAFGPVLSLWHDHRTEGIDDPEHATLPEKEELLARNQLTDISKVIIDPEASTVFLEEKGMRLDVGAIAKGYATEQTALDLESKGFVNGMISVGGNVRAIGHKFEDANTPKPWGVGIQNPDLSSEQSALVVLELSEKSLVTSGIYERYYTVDGKQYHHIIDPDTLMPADYFASVSVVCKDSGLADALSTALFNMDQEAGEKLVESLEDVEVLWIYKDQTTKQTDGFEAYKKK